MRKVIVAVLIGCCALAAAAFGWFRYFTGDARRIDNAQVFVTFYDSRADCTVSLGGSGKPHALLCADVLAYIRDQLKIPAGGTFVTQDFGNTHATEITSLISVLQKSGYQSVGRRAVFITEP
jgi:hypothetical protein